MKKISRHIFLKRSLQIGTGLLLLPVGNGLLANAAGLPAKMLFKDELLKRLVLANDKQVAKLLETDGKPIFSRRTGHEFAALSASYCTQDSKFYHSQDIVAALGKRMQLLQSSQSKDGTVNIGNIESPPDTAFLLELLTAGAYILSKDDSKELTTVKNDIKDFIIKAGDGLRSGGVHTPNHRWVICAALARIHSLYPNEKYLLRIEDWLGEGIYMDKDGHYPERSRNYDVVENNSLLTMGRLLNKPQLFAPVRKNLEMTYYYMEPNGDLITTDSRRQDQYSSISIVSFYLYYRELAIRDNNSKFAAIARLIENNPAFEEQVLNRDLFHFLENPLLQQELPASASLPVDYEKWFTTSHLVRTRKGDRTATLFGGVDWPLIIASGRSNSPNFFSYRKGTAILNYMRLSSNFFSTGYFYSDGVKKVKDQYVLHNKLSVPYYQPLPKKLRKANGDYTLSPSIDNRFWNKMDFSNRPVSNVKVLETTISFSEKETGTELNFEISGQEGVPVTIELCFKEGGTLSGIAGIGNDNSILEKDFGKYEYEGDVINFGPGSVSHKTIRDLEGERYSTHFGTLRTKGMHVYLTGTTPFKHTLVFS